MSAAIRQLTPNAGLQFATSDQLLSRDSDASFISQAAPQTALQPVVDEVAKQREQEPIVCPKEFEYATYFDLKQFKLQ